ncbi:MAG: IPT/TIG domain-containing protein [Nocardioides sp.]
MSVFAADRTTRLTKTAFDAKTSPVTDPDPLVTVNEDIYEHYSLPGTTGEAGTRLLFNAGQEVRQSVLDRLWAAPDVVSISPATGPAAGGTAVRITGHHFTTDSTVTVGGTAATSIVLHDEQTLTCVTPAGAAGAVDVVVGNDSGTTATVTGGFTYA